MRHTLTTLICLIACLGLNAQTCIPAGTSLVLSSQQDIDDFSYNYSGCTQLEGNLFIQDMVGDITNLDGLSNITSVGGYIYIRQNHLLTDISGLSNITSLGDFIFMYFNDLLTNLDGFSGLSDIPGFLYLNKMDGLVDLTGLNSVTSIGKFIYLNDNAVLTSVSALSSLTSIGGFFIARNNDLLPDFTGLEGLNSIPGILHVANNGSLVSLKGLDNVTTVDSFTYILNNNALTSFSGLESLTSIADYLYINDNINIQDFNAFSNLTSVGENFYIGNAPLITSLSGFENLSSIGGSLSIFNCDDLVSIEGLDGIDPNTITELYIEQNNDLKTCESTLVCSYLSLASPASFTGNHPACGNRPTVEARCNGIYPISQTAMDQCTSIPPVEISVAAGNTNQDVDILNANCDVLCTINANGNDLGNVYFESYLSSTTRYVGMSYMNRDISITPQNQPTSDVEVTWYYTAAEYAALQAADALIVSPADIITRKSPEFCSAGIDISYPYVNQKISGFYGTNGDIYITADVSSFSTFYQHGSDVLILPVELINFYAKLKNNQIHLDWSTLTETDNDYFEIQHSTDGENFSSIGVIKGANNSIERLDYNYIHTNPTSGVNCYRLKQIDLNGEFKYSKIVIINWDTFRLGMFPNPATDALIIGADAVLDVHVSILNSVGSKVMELNSSTNTAIDISSLPKGIYHVIAISGTSEEKYRLMKI